VLWKRIYRFLRESRGLETVEWAIVGGIVVAVGAMAWANIGDNTEKGLKDLREATEIFDD
jgi:hypothetical protein